MMQLAENREMFKTLVQVQLVVGEKNEQIRYMLVELNLIQWIKSQSNPHIKTWAHATFKTQSRVNKNNPSKVVPCLFHTFLFLSSPTCIYPLSTIHYIHYIQKPRLHHWYLGYRYRLVTVSRQEINRRECEGCWGLGWWGVGVMGDGGDGGGCCG